MIKCGDMVKVSHMNVAYCFDNAYVMPTLVSATSLLKVTPDAIIFLFYRDVPQPTLKFLELALLDKHPQATLKFRSLRGHDWAAAGYGSHLLHTSKCTNDRLVIPEILNQTDPDVNRILYLDGDTIVFRDVSKYVASLNLPSSGVAARRVGCIRSKVWGHGAAGGTSLARSTPALNAGVLVLDLKTLEAKGFSKFCSDVLERRATNDQSVLNLYCHGCFAKLPPEMNLFVSETSKTNYFGSPIVLHCAGQSLKFWAQTERNASADRYKALWRSLLPSPERHAALAEMAKSYDETTTKTFVDKAIMTDQLQTQQQQPCKQRARRVVAAAV